MQRKITDIEISTFEGRIFIEQFHFGRHEPESIALEPDNISILIDWLLEAQKELAENG